MWYFLLFILFNVIWISVSNLFEHVLGVPGFRIIDVNTTFFNVTWTTVAKKNYGSVVFIEYRKEGKTVCFLYLRLDLYFVYV